jgi:hypothetical protein
VTANGGNTLKPGARNPSKLLLTAKGRKMPTPEQTSTTSLLRGWERINTIKNQLVKAGLLNGDATPAMVLAKLREVVPAEVIK